MSSLLNITLNIDKRSSDVCCNEFSVPQIDRKSKYIKNNDLKNCICNQYGVKLAKLEAIKMNI